MKMLLFFYAYDFGRVPKPRIVKTEVTIVFLEVLFLIPYPVQQSMLGAFVQIVKR